MASLVLGHGDVAAGRALPRLAVLRPIVENRQDGLRREGPAEAAALEQARQLVAGRAGRGGQRNAREEIGAGGADVGVRRNQLLLGGADVGPHGQQVGWQAGRQVRPAGSAPGCAPPARFPAGAGRPAAPADWRPGRAGAVAGPARHGPFPPATRLAAGPAWRPRRCRISAGSGAAIPRVRPGSGGVSSSNSSSASKAR